MSPAPSESFTDGDKSPSRQSRIISRVLSPAFGLWLRSQAEQVGTLEFRLEGGDRQILSGYIPKVFIAATDIVYKGLHLSAMEITGQNIRVNLGQVLRGKPLQLTEVILIDADVVIREADFNESLQAPLLAQAVTDFLQSLLTPEILPGLTPGQSLQMQQAQVEMAPNQLLFQARLLPKEGDGASIPFTMRTDLGLEATPGGNKLQLRQPEQPGPDGWIPILPLENFTIDLGSDLDLRTLAVEAGQLVCQAEIKVIPAEVGAAIP